jgi:hypothetical protein
MMLQAEGVAQAVAALLRRGVPPNEVGVIAFYKAQVQFCWGIKMASLAYCKVSRQL